MRWLERYITESAPNPQSVAKVVASLAGRIEDWTPKPASNCYRLLTLTAKLAFAEFALESVAKQPTRVLPTRKNDPGRGAQIADTVPSTASEAVTV
jgi:hypothetical protein